MQPHLAHSQRTARPYSRPGHQHRAAAGVRLHVVFEYPRVASHRPASARTTKIRAGARARVDGSLAAAPGGTCPEPRYDYFPAAPTDTMRST